jgi:peptide/nickel transport system permease protein
MIFKHKNFLLGVIILGTLILVCLLGSLAVQFDPSSPMPLEARLEPGAKGHWFGTDDKGFDVAARFFAGAKLTLITAVSAMLIAVCFGLPLGAFAGYMGGRWDAFLSMVMNTMLSFPSLLTAICIVSLFETKSLWNLLVAVSLVEIPRIARQARAAFMVEKQKDYLMAVQALGASRKRQIFKTLLPNCLAPIIVVTTMGVGGAVLEIAGLSFIGLGAAPGTAEWGLMMSDAKDVYSTLPWAMAAPGVGVALAVLGFNLLGDGLQDKLNVKLSKS